MLKGDAVCSGIWLSDGVAFSVVPGVNPIEGGVEVRVDVFRGG